MIANHLNGNYLTGHFRDNLFHGSGVFIVRTNMFRFDGKAIRKYCVLLLVWFPFSVVGEIHVVSTDRCVSTGSWKKGKPDGKFNVFLMDEKSKKKREVYSGAYRCVRCAHLCFLVAISL